MEFDFHCRPGDVFVHAELQGAPVTLVKAREPGAPVPPLSVAQVMPVAKLSVAWVFEGPDMARGKARWDGGFLRCPADWRSRLRTQEPGAQARGVPRSAG